MMIKLPVQPIYSLEVDDFFVLPDTKSKALLDSIVNAKKSIDCQLKLALLNYLNF